MVSMKLFLLEAMQTFTILLSTRDSITELTKTMAVDLFYDHNDFNTNSPSHKLCGIA